MLLFVHYNYSDFYDPLTSSKNYFFVILYEYCSSHYNLKFVYILLLFTYTFDQRLGHSLVDFISFNLIERRRSSSPEHVFLTLLQVRSVRLSTTLCQLFVCFAFSNIVCILPSVDALRRVVDVALMISNWH